MSSGENERAADHFERLPDDVVLVIFNKLWDAKLLGRCSTVCKRFASLTRRVGNVFLSLLPFNRPSFPKIIVDYFLNLFRKKPAQPPSPFRDTILKNLNISLDTLSQFEEIRHLRLQLPPYSDDVVGDDSFIWGYERECFAHLAFRSLLLEHESKELETHSVFEITQSVLGRRRGLVTACFTNALRMRFLLLALIGTYPELRSISVDDKNELGVSQCVSGGRLAELKELVDSNPLEMLLEIKFVKFKVCNLRSLRLPAYGGTMDEVTLTMFGFRDGRGGGGGGDDCCSDAAVMACFQEEEAVFREAVEEILTKHKDEVSDLHF